MTVSNPNKNDPVYKILQNVPFNKQSIHNIRLKFKVPNIWNILKEDPNLSKNETSKDLSFPVNKRENSSVSVTIHKTNTISIIIGCTIDPIPLDTNGMIRFFTLLTRIEEQISSHLTNYCSSDTNVPAIPNYRVDHYDVALR